MFTVYADWCKTKFYWLLLFVDCPQVQCIKRFNATEPDELGLEESDVVNVFKKMADGMLIKSRES